MKLLKMIAIVGPTASGKTGISVEIAKKIGGEIISVDSRQMYCGMDIGTAKVSEEEKQGVPHFGVDILNPDEEFTAHQFKEYAEQKIEGIIGRGHIPMLVGGTGLYVQAIVDNFDFEQAKGEPKYDVLQIGLFVPRDELYQRIDARVDRMMADGLVEEVRNLKKKYGCEANAMTGIGYRQMCEYLDGKVNLDEAIRITKRDSRHYAKRQMTWFKRDNRIWWVKGLDEAMQAIENWL